MLLERRVVAIDAASQSVTTADGEIFIYGHQIWATGGTPRRLSSGGHDLRGVHTVRTREDADRMAGELKGLKRAVVIGGGFIGLEAAAVLAKAGKGVTLLEAQDRLLARVAGEPISRFFEDEHRSHGVDLRLGATVDCLLGDEQVTGVRLSDGRILDCEMVIVGIGILPAVEPLLAAGARGGNGVDIDAQCRTSLPNVFAVGDCARHRNGFAICAHIRLESVKRQ